MIDFSITIRRTWFDIEGIEQYEKAIEKKLEQLKDTFEIREALINKDLIAAMKRALKKELDFCEFYKIYKDRYLNELNFNEWIFTKKENIKPRWGWNDIEGDQWTKTNGKVKAIILVAKREKNTKVQLSYENDSHSELGFIESDYGSIELDPHYLRNPDSIKQRIKELKGQADHYLKTHLYPRWNTEITNMKGLDKLLCIKDWL